MPGKTKPHTQIGQKGKGKNRRKRRVKPQKFPPYETAGLPIELGQYPKSPPQIPNFLPNTAGFEHAQTQANDFLSQAGAQYRIATGLIEPQLALQQGRLKTDQGVAQSRLDENLAERGVFQSGIRPELTQRNIVTPFGRQHQDLAAAASQAYADASSQYGQAQLQYNQMLMDAYNQRANEAYDMAPLSVPTGGYDLPNMPGPMMTSGVNVGGGGRTRPRRNRNRRRGGNR